MMTRLLAVLLATLSISCPAIANAGDLKPYQGGDWSSIVKTAKGAPVAIHFWGVTCSVCVKELPQWGQFLATNPNVHLIFIQVDDVSAEMIQKMLAKANLGKAKNYYVNAAFDEQLRHEIDPKWRGETPVTILIDKSGRPIRKTGPMNFSQLQSWFGS